MKESKKYYLGLDIGTNSVGYAVTGENYSLLKFRGEPVWGITTFEEAELAENRRINRTARRRLDRRQQRVRLLHEIFAPYICRVDPNFFIRRSESALFSEDTQHGVRIFDGGIDDKEYYRKYPTIHHLIVDLMTADSPRDIRLIYLACAWLVANRGHFLSEASADQFGNFQKPYAEFLRCFNQNYECQSPWADSVSSETVQEIMQTRDGINQKKSAFKTRVFGGNKPSRKPEEEFPFSRDAIVSLLSGGKVSSADLFGNEAYKELDSVALSMDEENFERILTELGDDADLLRKMRAMYDCALLNITLQGKQSISEAKVAIYEQHKRDLIFLKYFIGKYCRKDYSKVFRDATKDNYVAYSGNVKSCKEADRVTRSDKNAFCDFVKRLVKDIQPEKEDQAKYADMMDRLTQYTFLPKQKDSDNRVIPHQLYAYELDQILDHASNYLTMLGKADADGITNADKIRAIFRFRIPYYVGPLNQSSPFAWLERKPDKIYPWNFEKIVDLDRSEQNFIRRMTNTCTYLPGEDVLPYCSLLYSRYMVLNEINDLKINRQPIPVQLKQEIYQALFVDSGKKVTKKTIAGYLKSHGYIGADDEISGVDDTIKANLKPYHSFRAMLSAGTLSEEQVEDIILHAAYSEDKSRMNRWLENRYPALSENDRKYILRLQLKEFGRLSGRLLTEIMGAAVNGSGEAMSIMDALWQTNDNLMQLLSSRYTFRDQIRDFAADYYSEPSRKSPLSQRLDDMYVSNSVKRQIIRSLDICTDVVKAMGCAPERIFVEMARGATESQKGKRTKSRKQQLLDLYKQVKHEDAPELLAELEAMGDEANSRLQSDKLFLYYLQLGKCAYTGQAIDLSQLLSKTYDIDHIYPQSKVQDDSILNNKVLCLSTENGEKGDHFPIKHEIREQMQPFWNQLKNIGLITEEKYHRLTRNTGFTDDELRQFINRQLVETRQSTRVVTQLLQERYPNAEIVYVKAGLVSRFRQEFDMLKCRSVNDLHHAKDAYLNVVVGNVYHEKFTRRWFDVHQDYSLNVRPLFTHPVVSGGAAVWNGEDDLAKVRKVMGKNAVHITQYAFCRHSGQNGGFFDQQPKKAQEGLIPRKKNLPAEKYGGYNGATTSFFVLVRYSQGKKRELMFFPVDLMCSSRFLTDDLLAVEHIAKTLKDNGKNVSNIEFPLGKRILKTNTVLSLDGFLCCLSSGSIKDGRVGFLPLTQFVCSYETERYIKYLERVCEKRKFYPHYSISEERDHVSVQENMKLYDLYISKIEDSIFSKRPGVSAENLMSKKAAFAKLPIDIQCSALLKMQMLFARQPNPIDLSDLDLSKNAFKARRSMYLSGWKKEYTDIRIVDMSASGLFESRSGNLLELL